MSPAKQWEIDLIFYHILSHPDNSDLFLWEEKLTGDEWAAERDQQPPDSQQGEINKASGFEWGWPIKGEE